MREIHYKHKDRYNGGLANTKRIRRRVYAHEQALFRGPPVEIPGRLVLRQKHLLVGRLPGGNAYPDEERWSGGRSTVHSDRRNTEDSATPRAEQGVVGEEGEQVDQLELRAVLRGESGLREGSHLAGHLQPEECQHHRVQCPRVDDGLLGLPLRRLPPCRSLHHQQCRHLQTPLREQWRRGGHL